MPNITPGEPTAQGRTTIPDTVGPQFALFILEAVGCSGVVELGTALMHKTDQTWEFLFPLQRDALYPVMEDLSSSGFKITMRQDNIEDSSEEYLLDGDEIL